MVFAETSRESKGGEAGLQPDLEVSLASDQDSSVRDGIDCKQGALQGDAATRVQRDLAVKSFSQLERRVEKDSVQTLFIFTHRKI